MHRDRETCFHRLLIHTYAGIQLRLKMHEIMEKQGYEEPTGQAKITSGYNLPADYILHTVGPIVEWKVTGQDEELLASCYRKCLELAVAYGVKSIAFCCLSTGVFRFPFKKLAREHKNIQMIRLNLDDVAMPEDLDIRGIGIEGDLACVIPQL